MTADEPGTDRDIDILVVGELNPDIVITDPDPVPLFGEVERIVGSIHMTVGSSSAIFACGAARLGLRVAFYGVVGDDAFGRFMLEEMARREIDVSACTVDLGRPTGATVILTSGADRAILTAIGAIGALDVAAVPASLIGRARHLHSGAFYLQETSRNRLPAFFASARDGGLTTSFDTNWDPTDQWDGGVEEMLRASDVFFPNAAEARRIARIDDVEEAAQALATKGSRGRTDGGPIVAVKIGPAGAVACRADGPIVRVPAMTIEPTDTTGAGDSFNAGFLHAWLDGGDLRDSLELGVVCGALSTRAAGGVDGQASLLEARHALALRAGG
ncbi:MAG: sugar kinase [Chloroflexota bacterium]|nr:sugar kinase [Chloroflexota bacterium]